MLERQILTRNAVHSQGHGPPVLLVHGFGCDQGMWNAMAPGFEEDHNVIRYDLTGMGASDYQAYDRGRHASLEGHADDLVAIIEALDVGPVTAIGHSVSAMIVALASIKRPDLFSALVMIGPSPCYIDSPPYRGGFSRSDITELLQAMRENYQGWAGQLASMVAGEQDEGDAETSLNDRFCRNDPEISQHFAQVTFLSDNRSDLHKITTPTLVVHCANDVIAPPAVSRYVQQHIKGAKLATIEGNGHAPHMTHPAETSEAVRSFLAGVR